MIVTFYSLESSGKTTLAIYFADYLKKRKIEVEVYDYTQKFNLSISFEKLKDERKPNLKVKQLQALHYLEKIENYDDLVNMQEDDKIYIFDLPSYYLFPMDEFLKFVNYFIVPMSMSAKSEYDTTLLVNLINNINSRKRKFIFVDNLPDTGYANSSSFGKFLNSNGKLILGATNKELPFEDKNNLKDTFASQNLFDPTKEGDRNRYLKPIFDEIFKIIKL